MIDRLDYPNIPGFKVEGPSLQAAVAVTDMAETLRQKVLNTIASAPAGLTADEVAGRLNRSVLSVRPRVAELHRNGEIRRTSERGKNQSGMSATIWVVSLPTSGCSNSAYDSGGEA